MHALSRTLFALAMLGMGLYVATHLRVGTNVTHFMPTGSASSLAVLSSHLADSELTRTMLLSVEAPAPVEARAAARELAATLQTRPEVAWVRTGIESDRMRDVFELYFPRRHYFLSPEPEREIPGLLSDTALRSRARDARIRLAQPSSTLLADLIIRDPIGAFERLLRRFRAGQSDLTLTEGQFSSADGRHALLMLGTHASAFDSGAQAPLLDALDSAIARLAARHPGLVVEQSGANRFAVHAERGIRADVYRIAAISALGILLLFVVFVGTLHSVALILLPTAAGIVVASFLGLLLFGALDGLTMAFGIALMGVAVDYSIHLVIHQAAPGAAAPAATARHLRPTLLLGAATTMASFAGLGLTAFPAFREMAFVSIVGVAVSVATTLWLLPGLLERAPSVPRRSAALAARLESGLTRLERQRVLLLGFVLATVLVAPILLPRLIWIDDLSRLSRFDPALQAEDRRVRKRVSQFETTRMVIGLAEDGPAALRLDERIQERMRASIAAGHVEAVRSIGSLVFSEPLQLANAEVVRRQPDLADRVVAAYAAEGFRPEAFASFGEALSTAPPPLALTELEASPLGDLVGTHLVPLGDQVGALTYLRGVEDADAIAAALEGLPGVFLFDQRTFIDEIYGAFRETTLQQMLVGSGLVVLALLVRYRRLRPALAAFLPSGLVALLLLEGFALTGTGTNLFHVMSLVMVMGMGVDYGVFVVDGARSRDGLRATALSLLVACLTTVFVFGTLALSDQPALRAIGVTTGAGILLSLALAPIALVVLPRGWGGRVAH